MDLLDGVDGVQEVRFTCAWRRSTDVHSGHRAALRQDDRTARGSFQIREVPDADTFNIGDAIASDHLWQRLDQVRRAARQCFPEYPSIHNLQRLTKSVVDIRTHVNASAQMIPIA